MKKNNLLIILLFLAFSAFSQSYDSLKYEELCVVSNKIKSKGNDALDVVANKFLEKGHIFLYFHLEKSDTLTITLNDSVVSRTNVKIALDRTGDKPDYSIKIPISSSKSYLTIYFQKSNSFIKFPLQKRYRVYQISSWQNCIYLTMKKYFRFS